MNCEYLKKKLIESFTFRNIFFQFPGCIEEKASETIFSVFDQNHIKRNNFTELKDMLIL